MNAFEPLTDCCLCHTNYLVPIPVGLVLQARPNQPQRGLLSVSCFQYHAWVGNKGLGCFILKVICTAVGWVWLARLAVAKVQKRHLKTISRDAASHSMESTRLQHHGIKFNIYVCTGLHYVSNFTWQRYQGWIQCYQGWIQNDPPLVYLT